MWRTTIYLSEPIRAALEGAVSVSGRLRDVCERYLAIIGMQNIDLRFSDDEIKLMQELFDNRVPALSQVHHIAGRIKDLHADGMITHIDGERLVRALDDLSGVERIALVELLERKRRAR